MRIQTLDELLQVLTDAPRDDREAQDYAARHGLPTTNGQIDFASLPTFGGEEPTSTHGVFSWDAHRLLVMRGATNDPTNALFHASKQFRIVARADVAEHRDGE